MNEMFQQLRNELKINLPEEIDHHSAEMIRKEADRRIERNSIRNIIFDFEKTVFMDSSGIGLLMGRYKMVSYIGGKVYAVRVSEKLKQLIQLAGINKYINVE